MKLLLAALLVSGLLTMSCKDTGGTPTGAPPPTSGTAIPGVPGSVGPASSGFDWSKVDGGKDEGPPDLEKLKDTLLPTPVPVKGTGSGSSGDKPFWEKIPVVRDVAGGVKDVLGIVPIIITILIIVVLLKIIGWLWNALTSPLAIFRIFQGGKSGDGEEERKSNRRRR